MATNTYKDLQMLVDTVAAEWEYPSDDDPVEFKIIHYSPIENLFYTQYLEPIIDIHNWLWPWQVEVVLYRKESCWFDFGPSGTIAVLWGLD